MKRGEIKGFLWAAVLLWSSALWSQPANPSLVDSTQLLKAQIDQGIAFQNGAKLDSALVAFNQVLLSNPEKYLDSKTLQKIHHRLGFIYRAARIYDKSLNHYLRLIELVEKEGDSSKIMSARNKVAIIYARTEQFEKGISLFKKVNRFAKRTQDTSLEIATTINLGGCLVDSGNLDQGYEVTKKALSLAKQMYQNDVESTDYRRTVGGLYYNLSDILRKKGDSITALEYAKKGLAFRKTRNNPWEISASYGQVFLMYLRAGNFSMAKMYLDSCEGMQERLLKGSTTLLRHKMAYYKEIGNYERAYHFAERVRKVGDSLNKAESDRQLNLLKGDFEMSQAAQELELLKKNAELSQQKLTLQNEKLQNRNIQRSILIIAIILSIVIIVLIYKRLKAKSEFAQSLNHKNEEISLLLKELQHRVKNNMQTILGLYETTLSRVPKSFPKEELVNFKNALTSLLLIQKKLFISDNKTLIALDDFIESFTEEYAVVKAHDKDVFFDLKLVETMVASEFGSKLALMLNELISNSYEHAFQDVANPKITIETTMEDNTLLLLKYTDNGTAFSLDEGLQQPGKMGLKILQSLVSEVRGTMEHSKEKKQYQFSFEIQHDNHT